MSNIMVRLNDIKNRLKDIPGEAALIELQEQLRISGLMENGELFLNKNEEIMAEAIEIIRSAQRESIVTKGKRKKKEIKVTAMDIDSIDDDMF